MLAVAFVEFGTAIVWKHGVGIFVSSLFIVLAVAFGITLGFFSHKRMLMGILLASASFLFVFLCIFLGIHYSQGALNTSTYVGFPYQLACPLYKDSCVRVTEYYSQNNRKMKPL